MTAHEARFWEKVAVGPEGECWPWTASTFHGGHGKFWLNGSNRIASRVAWALAFGEIPDDLLVRHTCDNPPCCNPGHLETGTTEDNVADRVEQSRLTAAAVSAIRRRYGAGNESYRTLAEAFGVDRITVRDVIKGRTWNHVLHTPDPGDPQIVVVRPEGE